MKSINKYHFIYKNRNKRKFILQYKNLQKQKKNEQILFYLSKAKIREK